MRKIYWAVKTRDLFELMFSLLVGLLHIIVRRLNGTLDRCSFFDDPPNKAQTKQEKITRFNRKKSLQECYTLHTWMDGHRSGFHSKKCSQRDWNGRFITKTPISAVDDPFVKKFTVIHGVQPRICVISSPPSTTLKILNLEFECVIMVHENKKNYRVIYITCYKHLCRPGQKDGFLFSKSLYKRN